MSEEKYDFNMENKHDCSQEQENHCSKCVEKTDAQLDEMIQNCLFYKKELAIAEEKLRLLKLQAEFCREIEADLENDDLTEWKVENMTKEKDELITMCGQVDFTLENFKSYHHHRQLNPEEPKP